MNAQDPIDPIAIMAQSVINELWTSNRKQMLDLNITKFLSLYDAVLTYLRAEYSILQSADFVRDEFFW